MKKTVKTTIQILMLIMLTSVIGHAAEAVLRGSKCVTAEVSDVSPSSVGQDEEFTVGIQVESCGDELPTDITYEITEISPDILVKESKSIKIPTLHYSNSERFIKYHMRTTTDAKPGMHMIKMRLTYVDEGAKLVKNYEIPIDVIIEEAELHVDSFTTDPPHVFEGDSVELKIGVINLGGGVAKSTSIHLDHPFVGTKRGILGTLTTNESPFISMKLKVNQSGSFDLPLTINYEDDFGSHQINSLIPLTILNKKGDLNIASVKSSPVLPYDGDTVELTMRIENYGDKTMNSVRVYLDHPFQGKKEAFIGTLESNEDGPAIFTFIADTPGEFNFPVIITYRDEFGEEQIESRVNTLVLQKEENSNKEVIGASIGGLFVIMLLFNIWTRRSKDKIIQQLMAGTNEEKSKSKRK